jgi:hypothetical protein
MSEIADSLRLKVKRAEDHFKDFKDRSLGADRFVRPAKSLGFHYHRDGQRIAVTPQGFSEPQPEWGVVLGDVLHQLRTTLDHLIYNIAKRRHAAFLPKEERSLHFPIFEDQIHFDADWRVSKSWRGCPTFWDYVIGVDAFTIVKLTQPYERYKSDATRDPLWHLHKLDNIDKHRTILVLDNRVSVSGTARSATMEMPFDVIKHSVNPGAEVFSIDWPLEWEAPEVAVESFVPHVVLTGTGICDNLRVYPLVRNMISAVTGVINTFESKSLI